ncbi:MAG: hypothetical protein AAGB46_15930 [Verrucomicrobiota bacterium]
MKKFIAVVVVLGVIGVVLVLGFSKFIGKGIAAGVESYGPEITQTEIRLDGVDLSALTGSGGISGLVVGNPDGFNSEYAIKLDRLKLKIQPMSVFSDKVVIEEVIIDGPALIYETTPMLKTNVGQILKNVESFVGPEDAETVEEESELKFQVDLIQITNVKVSLATQLAGGAQASIKLKDLTIEDLGQGPEGITIGDIVKALFKSINAELIQGVIQSNQNLGGGLQNIGKGIEKNVGGMLKGLKDSFKKSKEE